MKTPLIIETTKSAIEVCSGTPKLIIVSNWYKVNPETKFLEQDALIGVLGIFTKKLLQMKFKAAKKEEQNIIVVGDTIMVFQSTKASGKLLTKEQAELSARAILEQFFKYAVQNGYFDEVDPEKLQETIGAPVEETKQ